MAIEYLGSVCKNCGGVFPPCVFDFHHRNPEEKDLSGGYLLRRKWSSIIKELDKCDLLCANCHRIEHHAKQDLEGAFDEGVEE